MKITIEIDGQLTDEDRALLVAMGGGSTALVTLEPLETAPEPVAPVKKAPAKKQAAPEPEPADDESDEDEPAKPAKKAPAKKAAAKAAADDDEDPMAKAVERATELVSSGQAAKVKAALADVGAKRVSELTAKSLPAFLAALDED